jgi:hypothetical protein
MYLFFEKILFPLMVILLGLLIFYNPMRFDWTQRITGTLSILLACYFVTHTLEKSKESNVAGGQTTSSPKPVVPHIAPSEPPPTPPRSVPEPQKHSPNSSARKLKSPLGSLSDGQRFVLKQKLGEYRGRAVRLVLIGNDPSNSIIFEELTSVFKDSEWKIERDQIGMVGIVGLNFPNGPYMTSRDVASPIVSAVFSIFSGAGVELPLAPNSFMGPGAARGTTDIVIVVH